MVETLYEVGRIEFEQRRVEVSIKWLQRAFKILEGPASHLRFEAEDLSLNVMHTYIQALLASDDSSCGKEAARLSKVLQESHGRKLAVMVLQLEMAVRDPALDPRDLFAELSTVIRNVHLIESNHSMVMFYLHHLKRLDNNLALLCIKTYIRQRLILDPDCSYTEGAIVNLIWMSTEVRDLQALPDPQEFLSWLEEVQITWGRLLSAEAAHGSFVVRCRLIVLDPLLIVQVTLEGHRGLVRTARQEGHSLVSDRNVQYL